MADVPNGNGTLVAYLQKQGGKITLGAVAVVLIYLLAFRVDLATQTTAAQMTEHVVETRNIRRALDLIAHRMLQTCVNQAGNDEKKRDRCFSAPGDPQR
jgi:hypothetical protein